MYLRHETERQFTIVLEPGDNPPQSIGAREILALFDDYGLEFTSDIRWSIIDSRSILGRRPGADPNLLRITTNVIFRRENQSDDVARLNQELSMRREENKWFSKYPKDERYGFHIIPYKGSDYFALEEVNREQCHAKRRRFERYTRRGRDEQAEDVVVPDAYIDIKGRTCIKREKYEDFLLIAPTIRVDI